MNLVINILCFLLLASCIGTIEDTKKVDRSTIKKDVKFSFAGVVECSAISDKKVEVSFDPAYVMNGSAKLDELVYKVFLNGNFDNSVSSMMAKDIRANSQGRFFLEVDNLSLNTLYNISVRVHDPYTGVQDNNSVSCPVRTLDQKLPIFDGLSEVTPFPGIEGQTSVLLKWTTAKSAEYLVGGIPATGYRISKYNIYVSGDSDDLSSMRLLTTLSESTSVPITQYQASGLLQGNRYFYMVRAVDEVGREDQNKKILAARTSTPQSLSFAGISSLSAPTNSSGYTSLRAGWDVPVGNFNRFRIFAIAENEPLFNSSSIDPNDTTYLKTEISNTAAVSSQVVGLLPDTNYAVFVVACMLESGTCIARAGDQKKLVTKTQPPLAPFGGITTIGPLDGVLGLNQAKINWSIPAISAGVCTGIRLFNNEQVVKECGDPDLGSGEPCISSSSISCSVANVNVANLNTDQEYCFTAAVYEGARVQAAPYVRKCVTTRFDPPVFQNPPTCTSIDGGTKIKLDWTRPSPEGLYTEYIAILKKDPGTIVNPSTFTNQAKEIYEGVSTDSHLPIAERYRFFTKAKSSLTHTISGLSPDTNYLLMVKTHMSNNGNHYYDQGTSIISCKTRPLSLNFGGWEHILAVGPRVAGFTSHRSTPTTETLAGWQSTTALDSIDLPARGVESETLLTSDGIYHPKVVRVETINKSNNGIVQLMWNELKTVDGLKISEFFFNEGISINPATDGYFIYRKVMPSFSNDAEYESVLNQIQGSNSGWELLNPGAPITMENGVGMFTDYLPTGFHPIHEAGNFRRNANTGKVVWYTVRFRVNGALARYTELMNKDALLPVIIPPANMASIHHWMSNKKVCELNKKDYDRNNNYRCQFGGLGTREIDNNFYYDVNGHSLIDRWNLGCNFTRYDEEKRCYNVNSSTVPLVHNTNGLYFGQNFSGYYFDAEIANKPGECTGFQTGRASLPNAPKGAVYYSITDYSCYLRVNELLTNAATDQTLHWSKIGDTNFEASRPRSSTTILPPSLPDEFLGRIYPNNNQPENGLGIGAVLTSNDSSLPSITNVNQDQAHFLCQSHAVQLQTGSNKSVFIRKRNILGPEHLTGSLPHPKTLDAKRVKVEQNLTSFSSSSIGSSIYMSSARVIADPASATVAAGCSINNKKTSYPQDFRNLLTKFYSYANNAGTVPTLWLGGAYDVTGLLDGKYNGTERCVSGFGLQDYVGSTDYWFAEKLLCHTDEGGSNADCEINPSTTKIENYMGATGYIWPPTRYSSTESTNFYIDYFKNGFDKYFSFKYYQDQDFSESFGVPDVRKTKWRNSIRGYDYPTALTEYLSGALHFAFKDYGFSWVTGTPLNCDSGACHPDDNFKLGTTPLTAGLTSFKDSYFQVEYNTSNLPSNSFFVRGRKRDHSKPEEGFNYNYTNNIGDVQFNVLKSGVEERVGIDKTYHSFSTRWTAPQAVNYHTGVRCAVKVTLDHFGNVVMVDDQEQE